MCEIVKDIHPLTHVYLGHHIMINICCRACIQSSSQYDMLTSDHEYDDIVVKLRLIVTLILTWHPSAVPF